MTVSGYNRPQYFLFATLPQRLAGSFWFIVDEMSATTIGIADTDGRGEDLHTAGDHGRQESPSTQKQP